jgi:hypothetical protein
MLRPILKVPSHIAEQVLPENQRTPDNILRAEYAYFFDQTWPGYEYDDVKNPLYKLQFHNNTQIIPGMFMNGRAVCEFCKKAHSDNCDFCFEREEEKTLLQVIM